MEIGGSLMKPNFESMTRQELKAYVLKNRDDQEALNILMGRRSPDNEATWYDFADNQEVSQDLLKRKINQEIKN